MSIFKKMSDGIYRLKEATQLLFDYYDIDGKRIHKNKFGIHGEIVVVEGDVPIDKKTGLSMLGENIVRREKMPNEILLGGSIYALEKMFNVVSSVNVEYLNNIMNIGTTGPIITDKYPRDNGICLWNCGIGGCGDSRKDIIHTFQQQRQLNQIIPFRVVDEPFQPNTVEYGKYYLMREEEDGRFAYYAKTFERTPVIVPLWKDAADEDQDGSPVVESDYTSTRKTPIEVFAECVCKLEKKDFREWFSLYEGIEDARINEVGLCTGILSTTEDGRPEYKQVRQASCCHFTNEPLHMDKDMSIVYRWYTA